MDKSLVVLLCLSILFICLYLGLFATSASRKQWSPRITYVKYDPAHRVSAPVDAVYTWVNPQDAAWQELYAKHVVKPAAASKKASKKQNARMSSKRFNNQDAPDAELRTSVELLLKHMPWVRIVYIATMRPQIPPCMHLFDPERVKVIHHDEFFEDGSVLPVFNSHAIEANLHNIPNLSKLWLYLNDDMMVGRPVEKNMMFHHDKPVLRGLWMPVYQPLRLDAHVSACVNSGKLLNMLWYYHNDHNVAAMSKDVVHATAAVAGDEWKRTGGARLRGDDQIVPLGLADNVGLMRGDNICFNNNPLKSYVMLYTLMPWSAARMQRKLPQYHFFCINNIPPHKLKPTINHVRRAFNLTPIV